MQADKVLERQLRVLQLDLQAAGRDCELPGLVQAFETSKSTLNRDNAYGPMGTIFIQITTVNISYHIMS